MNNNKKRLKKRVIALLTRNQMEFLDKLGMDSLFSSGHKLSRVDIISAFVDAAMASGITAEGVKNKKELIQKILTSIKKERRKYPRINETLEVQFRKMDSLGKYQDSTVDNISMGGFKIDIVFMDRPLEVGQIIEISINDPEEKEKPMKAIGRIAWLKQKDKEHEYEAGIMLTYLKKEDRDRFESYLTEEASMGKPEKRKVGDGYNE